MTRRVMPPGRVSREAVRRLLARNGLKPRHADHRGHREGIFVWQRSDTSVSVSVDIDAPELRAERFEELQEVLTGAGYTLERAGDAEIPRWVVTRPVADGESERQESSGGK